MSAIHKLVRAELAGNAARVRVRLENARARERTLPMTADSARIRVAREIREYKAQLEDWTRVMSWAMSRTIEDDNGGTES